MGFFFSKSIINRLLNLTLPSFMWYCVPSLIGMYTEQATLAFLICMYIFLNCSIMMFEFLAWNQPRNKRTVLHSPWLSLVWIFIRQYYPAEHRQEAVMMFYKESSDARTNGQFQSQLSIGPLTYLASPF